MNDIPPSGFLKIDNKSLKEYWLRIDESNTTLWRRRYVYQNAEKCIKETIIDIDKNFDNNYIEATLNKDKSWRCCFLCNKYDISKVIETASRLFFLAGFGCFNIGYWVMYVRK